MSKTRSCVALMIAFGCLTSGRALAGHDCCELAPPQGCASGADGDLVESICTALGGTYEADMQCSVTTGNCETKTDADESICCLEDCANTQQADPLGECGTLLSVPAASEWALATLTLVLLTAGTILVRR